MAASDSIGTVFWLALASMIFLSGCLMLQKRRESASETPLNERELEGVWDGISINDCSPIQVDPSRCRAVERISFTMLPQRKHMGGFYRCTSGPIIPCYNFAERGVIRHLRMNGDALTFRVMRDDGSSCLFNTVPSANRMVGGFLCLNGDALVERGFWQVKRIY